jgi:hypothetical protein
MAQTRISMVVPLALVLAGSVANARSEPHLRPGPPSPEFVKRMMREARRELARSPDPLPAPAAVEDPEAEEMRGRQAERILKRAVRGALGDRVGPLLRSWPAFEALLGRPEMVIARRPPAEVPDPAISAIGSARPSAGRVLSGSLGFRLDAHPRLLLRGRLHGARGVIELPVLEREVRLSIDQPIGARGAASIRGGWSEGPGDWVTLSLSLSF